MCNFLTGDFISTAILLDPSVSGYLSLESPRIAPTSPSIALLGITACVKALVVVKLFLKYPNEEDTSNANSFGIIID
jgi:hypothetical protein